MDARAKGSPVELDVETDLIAAVLATANLSGDLKRCREQLQQLQCERHQYEGRINEMNQRVNRCEDSLDFYKKQAQVAAAMQAFWLGGLTSLAILQHEEDRLKRTFEAQLRRSTPSGRQSMWDLYCQGKLRTNLDKCLPEGHSLGVCISKLHRVLSNNNLNAVMVAHDKYTIPVESQVPEWGLRVLSKLAAHRFGGSVTFVRFQQSGSCQATKSSEESDAEWQEVPSQ